MSAGPLSPKLETAMTTNDLDLKYEAQEIARADTIAWDKIYAKACRSARETGYA